MTAPDSIAGGMPPERSGWEQAALIALPCSASPAPDPGPAALGISTSGSADGGISDSGISDSACPNLAASDHGTSASGSAASEAADNSLPDNTSTDKPPPARSSSDWSCPRPRAERTVTIHWPDGRTSQEVCGRDWLAAAQAAGQSIPTACLGGSCGACEIEVNGQVVRACIAQVPASRQGVLRVELASDPFW